MHRAVIRAERINGYTWLILACLNGIFMAETFGMGIFGLVWKP
jgi:hypothetical protein